MAETDTMLGSICDMTVDSAEAAREANLGGTTYYFCSGHCQKLFQSDPAKYLAPASARQSPPPSAPVPHQQRTRDWQSKSRDNRRVHDAALVVRHGVIAAIAYEYINVMILIVVECWQEFVRQCWIANFSSEVV